MTLNSTTAPKVPDGQSGNIEDPWMKSRRLSRELALCLDQMDPNIEYVMICPASKAKPEGGSFIAYGPFNEDGAQA